MRYLVNYETMLPRQRRVFTAICTLYYGKESPSACPEWFTGLPGAKFKDDRHKVNGKCRSYHILKWRGIQLNRHWMCWWTLNPDHSCFDHFESDQDVVVSEGDVFTDRETSRVVDRPITRWSGRRQSALACLRVDTDRRYFEHFVERFNAVSFFVPMCQSEYLSKTDKEKAKKCLFLLHILV